VEWRFGKNMVTRIENQMQELPTAWLQPKFRDMDVWLPDFKNSGILNPDKEDPIFWEKKERGMVFQQHVFDMAKKRRDQYVTWMAERNPKRHEMELKFGYDCKNAGHLIRLLRMGLEILTTGEVKVFRPDAAELLSIRQGGWKYEEVIEHADDLKAQIDGLKTFAVPKLPNYDLINETIIAVTKKAVGWTATA
jgi:hypothetical protein